MEMRVPIPLVFCPSRFASGRRKIMAAVSAALMACTIFLSGSRGGMMAFSVQMGILAILLMSKHTHRKAVTPAVLFFLIVIGLTAWIGGGELSHRLASINTESQT